MAQERGYQAQVAPARPVALPNAPASAFGAEIGAAVAQAGQQIHRQELREFEIDRQNRADSEAANFNRRFTDVRAAYDVASIDARNSAAAGGAGHAARMAEWWEKQSAGLLDGISDSRVRRQAEAQLQDFGARTGSAEYAWAEGARVKKLVSDTGEATAIAANRARRNHDQTAFEQELVLGRQAIEAMPGVADDLKDGLIQQHDSALAGGFLTGLIDTNAKAVAPLLDSGRFDDLLDPGVQEQLRSRADVEIRRAAAAARAEAAAQKVIQRDQLATVRAMLDTGAGTPDDWEKLASGYSAIGEEAQAVTARAKGGEMRTTIQYRGSSLTEMDERVAALQRKRNGGGLSTAEAAELGGLTDLRQQTASRLNEPGGALSQYLFATGKTLPPLNPDDAGAMRSRAQLAAAAAARYGRGVVEPITETELPMFRDMFASGPAGKVRALEAIRRFGDARSVAGAARQIAGSDDGDFRLAAMLPPSVARDVLLGPDKLKTQPGVLNAKEAARVLSNGYGPALRHVGGGYDADVLKAATQFYSSRMIDGGETAWDPRRFEEAIETVLGRTRSADGTIRGGIALTGQGKIIVPPDRTPDALLQSFARAGEPDYRAAAGGRAPRWGDGSTMTLGQLRSLLPTYRGNGRYGFRARDGRLIPNDKGGVYEVDIYQLKAR